MTRRPSALKPIADAPLPLIEAAAAWLRRKHYGHDPTFEPWAKVTPTLRAPWLGRARELLAEIRTAGFKIPEDDHVP